MVKRLKIACRVITTYLDNDDALDIRFVENLQARASRASSGQFLSYSNGYQYYTDYNYLLYVHYSRNHFVSVVEDGNPASVKTIYGFGSHYYIDKIAGAKIEVISNQPLWCEVIHEKNMGNDAYFLLGTKIMKDADILRRDFGIDAVVKSGIGLYVLRFLPRYVKTFARRVKYFLFGRKW